MADTDIVSRSGKAASLSATDYDQNLNGLHGLAEAKTGTTYEVVYTDQGKTIELNNASMVCTLDAIADIAALIDTSGFSVTLKNINAAAATVQRSSTDTIAGSTSITLVEDEVVTLQFDSTGGEWTIKSTGVVSSNTTLTSPTLTSPVIDTGVSGTAKIARLDQSSNTATTSGTTVDIGSIPSWAKKLTVTLAGVSTNGTSDLLLQIGDSGGIETTSYVSAVCIVATTVLTSATSTAGFILNNSFTGASAVVSGTITLTLHDASNKWVSSGVMLEESGSLNPSAGYKSLSGTLTQVRLTSVSADTFDAGSIRVIWEG